MIRSHNCNLTNTSKDLTKFFFFEKIIQCPQSTSSVRAISIKHINKSMSLCKHHYFVRINQAAFFFRRRLRRRFFDTNQNIQGGRSCLLNCLLVRNFVRKSNCVVSILNVCMSKILILKEKNPCNQFVVFFHSSKNVTRKIFNLYLCV